jgi:feruloyl esterase
MKHHTAGIPWQLCRHLFLGSFAVVAAMAAPADPLAALRQLGIDAGKIVLAEDTSTTTDKKWPPHTVVKIVLNPAKDSNIHVEIWLPEAGKWNNRFIGLGNGGAAGHINPGSLAGPLARGYAVATTDMGTSPNSDSGIGKPDVWKDFGYRATHLMTVCAKQVIQSYYGRSPEYSYFKGVWKCVV